MKNLLSHFLIGSIILSFFAVGLLVLPAPSHGGNSNDIKILMGENFQNLSKILQALITARYETLSKDVGSIEHHAKSLMDNPPDFIKDGQERNLFNTYANTLKIRSGHLRAVVEELVRRDAKPTAIGTLNIDYLRGVAAEHYGQMVTSCVLCHNQFRRRISP